MRIVISLLLCGLAYGFPEIGHWEVSTVVGNVLFFSKSVYDGSSIYARVTCSKDIKLKLTQSLYWSECADAFADIPETSKVHGIPMHMSPSFVHDFFKKDELYDCKVSESRYLINPGAKAGSQLYIISTSCVNDGQCNGVEVKVVTDMNSTSGYISAIEYPLRTFYALLLVCYVGLGLLWAVFTVCHWKDLLRIQYYITLVIFIGIVEQSASYAIYDQLNSTGLTIKSALIFALIISCIKRTLARFLVMIACVGYGITKSRLGTAYRRIVWICVAYLFCSIVDSGLRVFQPRFKPSLRVLLAGLPLIMIDLAILWWSFSYLVTTLRETRMRRNRVKYRLYKIFSGLLIFVALVSVACMCVSIFMLHWRPCTKHWRYIWFDETFWQLLFFVVLTSIVVLWRPSSTNKLYARSAFLDPDVEPPPEDLEELLIDAIVTGISDTGNNTTPKVQLAASEDDALRWAEENIPSANGGSGKETGDQSPKGPVRPPLKVD